MRSWWVCRNIVESSGDGWWDVVSKLKQTGFSRKVGVFFLALFVSYAKV